MATVIRIVLDDYDWENRSEYMQAIGNVFYLVVDENSDVIPMMEVLYDLPAVARLEIIQEEEWNKIKPFAL